jgi:hypothetical protein
MMSDEANGAPPIGFYIVAGVALLWNLAGLAAYYSQVTMSPEAMSQLSEAERMLYESMPVWVTGAFGVAVTAGPLGCILLLLRKALAFPVFILSLVGVLLQHTWTFLIADAMSVYGPMAIAGPAAVILVGVYLIWYSRDAKSKGWLS